MTPGSPSKYYFHQPRRRTHVARILAVFLAIVLCYIVATRGPDSSQWAPTTIQDKVNFGDHAEKPVSEVAPPRGYSDTESGRWTEPVEEEDEIVTDIEKEMEHTVDRIEGDAEAEYEKLKDSQTDDKYSELKEGSDYVSARPHGAARLQKDSERPQ